MVDSAFLSKMKKDAVLINTARGAVVKDEDLLAHLDANKDFFYGADVLQGEPSAKVADFENKVAQHPQAYVTHHVGAGTKQAEAAIGVEAVRVVRKFKDTQVVDNCINRALIPTKGTKSHSTAGISGTGLASEALFEKMIPVLETNGEEFVKKVGAVFHFDIKKDKSAQPVSFTLDLKNGKGSYALGKEGKADAVFTMIDGDLIAMA
jgi:hypothetical protein